MEVIARDPEILSSSEEIMALLGVGERRFRTLLKKGLPARYDGHSYGAHRSALLAWWRDYTSGAKPEA